MDNSALILRKKKELEYSNKRLISAIDDKNQFAFHPDPSISETELSQNVARWKTHIKALERQLRELEYLQTSFDEIWELL